VASPPPVAASQLRQRNYEGQQGQWCLGANAVGFDLGAGTGRYGSYTQPSEESLRYFADQGANCFRLPMTIERMGMKGDSTLDLIPGIEETVNYITDNLSSYVIIDPHNNEQGLRYDGEDIDLQDFVNLWIGAAKMWGNSSKVIFGLYNEPRYGFSNGQGAYFNPDSLDRNGEQISQWTEWMQAAIHAIRAQGANNLILVPGLHWTSTPQWDGGGWWGETIDGMTDAGNTRLASLTDPANRIAYDVHSYMDGRFAGESAGCDGYAKNMWGGLGADEGLDRAIAWAKKYNKKFMVTEMGSWPTDDGTNAVCEKKMLEYISRMDESGVFIGRQVWQFGCPGCLADQWEHRPYNFGWYQIKRCAEDNEDCGLSACCYDPAKTCYMKNDHWAACLDSCAPGQHYPGDPPDDGGPWNCTALASLCPEDGEDCRQTMCCRNPKSKCYVKNDEWATCRPSCFPGVDEEDPEEYRTPWSCETLTRTARLS